MMIDILSRFFKCLTLAKRLPGMKSVTYILSPALLGLSISSASLAYENPFLSRGANSPDSQLGAFSQNNTGDCFFLASLIAIAQDADGQTLIESSFHTPKNSHPWQIYFPNWPDQAIEITAQDINEYQLTHTDGQGLSAPVKGDPDVRILEIAADKWWKNSIKPEGLWDDIPMNAVFMFSGAEQLLLWNRAKASIETSADIDKYQRLPEGIIQEINLSSSAHAAKVLQEILTTDTDGISMILIDYINYHAVAMINIDFKLNTYSYIDTNLITHPNQNLQTLLQRLANGQYAINYLEIK